MHLFVHIHSWIFLSNCTLNKLQLLSQKQSSHLQKMHENVDPGALGLRTVLTDSEPQMLYYVIGDNFTIQGYR